jgi:hypothetical protein
VRNAYTESGAISIVSKACERSSAFMTHATVLNLPRCGAMIRRKVGAVAGSECPYVSSPMPLIADEMIAALYGFEADEG